MRSKSIVYVVIRCTYIDLINQLFQMQSIWARLKFVQRASMSVYSYCLLISRSFHGVTLKSVVLETVRSLFGIVEELYNKFFEGFKNPQM